MNMSAPRARITHDDLDRLPGRLADGALTLHQTVRAIEAIPAMPIAEWLIAAYDVCAAAMDIDVAQAAYRIAVLRTEPEVA